MTMAQPASPEPHPLGAFLRARRERVDPGILGLRTIGPRRTPGLRREELAGMAGISVEYLVRLERGRDRNPSPSVVHALAEALNLDEAARAHLALLADVRLDPDYADAGVAETLQALIESLPYPAMVLNRFVDVLALNQSGLALYARLGLHVGDNLTLALFLDPRSRDHYPDFDQVSAEAVANLRALAGASSSHPRLVALVGELSLGSPEFAALWAQNEVQAKSGGTKRIDVAGIGRLTLRWDSLAATGAPGQMVVAYQPVAGTGTAELLDRLA